MGCPSCGAENPSTNKFCGECGVALVLTCAECGERNPPTSRFCGKCGARLVVGGGAGRSALPAPAAPASSPETYTPRHLAEKILASRAGLEGERKQLTVLFADVVGSTELIQGRDAEEAQAILDGVVRVLMNAIHRYEGTVSRLMGDGLMAMFGAPIGHEDHAVRACYAALAMLHSMRRYAEAARRDHRITPTIRVGLSAGEVVARAIRDDLHMDYTAMGQTVHLASRLEQLGAGAPVPRSRCRRASWAPSACGNRPPRRAGAVESVGLGHTTLRLHRGHGRHIIREQRCPITPQPSSSTSRRSSTGSSRAASPARSSTSRTPMGR
jgi:class 3 adenylate cyclase